MKSSLLATLATAALCVCAVASAQPPNPPSPQQQAAWEAKRMDRLAILLDLTASQKAQVQTILDSERTRAQAAFAQFKASGTRPTREQMKATHDQLKADTQQQLSTVLSPAQLNKFKVLGEGFGGHRFRHRHGPPPGSAPPAGGAPN
jgi:Spy/CpxP family protein refolding chaperone